MPRFAAGMEKLAVPTLLEVARRPPVLCKSILVMLLVLALTANWSTASTAVFVPPITVVSIADQPLFRMLTGRVTRDCVRTWLPS